MSIESSLVGIEGEVPAMNKKVYFAGSIRGGRQDAELYKNMIVTITDIISHQAVHGGF